MGGGEDKLQAILLVAQTQREQAFAAATKIHDTVKDLQTHDHHVAQTCIQELEKLESRYTDADRQFVEANSQLPEAKQHKEPSKYSAFFEICLAIRVKCVPIAKDIPSAAATQTPSSELPLPRIQLPKFHGQIEHWPEFIALFDALVHLNATMPDAQKFHFLRSSLTGEALSVIASLELTASNYALAYKALQQRYQNHRRLANMYLSQVLNFPKFSTASVDHLKRFVSIHQNAIHALKALPIDDLADFLLFSLTFHNLDTDSRQRFEQQVSPEEFPSLAKLLQFSTQLLRVLESTTVQSPASKPHSPSRSTSSSHQSSFARSQSHASRSPSRTPHSREYSPRPVYSTVKSANSSTSSPFVCEYCNVPGHSIRQCREFKALTSHQRRDYVEHASLCRNCLSAHHQIIKCQSAHSCHVCGERHHTILHLRADDPWDKREGPKQPYSHERATRSPSPISSGATRASSPRATPRLRPSSPSSSRSSATSSAPKEQRRRDSRSPPTVEKHAD